MPDIESIPEPSGPLSQAISIRERRFHNQLSTINYQPAPPQAISNRERRWLLGIVWSVCTLFLCGLTIADPDLWGHTLYGVRAIEAGILAERIDPFSYTAAGATWINHEWLTERIYGGLWLSGGSLALVLWRNVLVIGLMILVAISIRRVQCGVAAGTLLLVLNAEFLADFVVFIRPQLATFVLFAWFLFALKTYHESPHRGVWSLPPLTALWVNLHGGFLAGLGILGLFSCGAICRALKSYRWHELVFNAKPPAADERVKPDLKPARIANSVQSRAARELAAVLLASFAATLVNPYGYELHVMLWDHLVTTQLVREWQPIWVTGHGLVSWVPFLLVGFTLLFSRRTDGSAEPISSGGSSSHRPPALCRLSWTELLVLAVVGWQAASHLRHVALFCITTLILLPGPLHQAMRRAFGILSARWSQPEFRRRRAAGVAAVCLFLGMLQVRGSIELWKHRLAPWDIAVECKSFVPGMPADAVAFIKKHSLDGNLITDYGWGQFVIWHLFPGNKVAFDGRYRTIYSAELERDFVAFQLAGVERPTTTPMLDAQPTEIALLPAGKSPDKYLSARADWVCVFRDSQSALYLKRLARFEHVFQSASAEKLTAKSGPAWTQFPGL